LSTNGSENNKETNLMDADEDALLDNLIAEALHPIAPSEVLRSRLRTRLLNKSSRSVAQNAGVRTIRLTDGVWRDLSKGIRVKTLLSDGSRGNSVLLQLAPGASLPQHRHHWLEEGIVLSGDFDLENLTLGPGDYLLSPPGSRHSAMISRNGAIGYVRGTAVGHTPALLRELIGAWIPLPDSGGQRLLRAHDGNWERLEAGVEKKTLASDGISTSQYLRIERGGEIALGSRAPGDELIVISGEAFVNDILLRHTEYQSVENDNFACAISSDVGALVFVRTIHAEPKSAAAPKSDAAPTSSHDPSRGP
jgi:quercetin dioxygenase-like cupin family protein